MAKVIKYQADYNRGDLAWRQIRTIQTENSVIKAAINKALETGPTKGFYKYELHSDEGDVFIIHSLNSSLFD